MEWTKSDTLKFIELWQGFPCLWNNKHCDYKNRQKRRDALEQLAEETNTNVNLVEKKIVILKTQYNRELSKLRAKSGSFDEVPTSNWYAFEPLQFLKDTISPRLSTDPLSIQTIEVPCLQESPTQQTGGIKRKNTSPQGSVDLLEDASKAICNKLIKDEYTVFGETIASELRDIKSKRHVLILKKEIMNLVYNTKIKLMEPELKSETEY